MDDINIKETVSATRTLIDDYEKINNYILKNLLGKGSYSEVMLAEDTETNKKYAAKIINKNLLEHKKKGFHKDEDGNLIVDNLLKDALLEIAILKKLNHKNVIKLHEIIHDDYAGEIILMLDYCSLGTVLEIDEDNNFNINSKFVKDKNCTCYSDDEIKDIIRDLVLGLSYLHANNIVHRDIKPDNILIDEYFNCKITDFNVSVLLDDKNGYNNSTGTLYFNAPEICQENQDENASRSKPLDIWALGVTTYIMAFGKLPFVGNNSLDISGLIENISNKEVEIPLESGRSQGLINLILLLLEKDPNKRITIDEIKSVDWLNENRENISGYKPDIISVSEEELNKSISFFSKFTIAKKCGVLWRKRTSEKKNLN